MQAVVSVNSTYWPFNRPLRFQIHYSATYATLLPFSVLNYDCVQVEELYDVCTQRFTPHIGTSPLPLPFVWFQAPADASLTCVKVLLTLTCSCCWRTRWPWPTVFQRNSSEKSSVSIFWGSSTPSLKVCLRNVPNPWEHLTV